MQKNQPLLQIQKKLARTLDHFEKKFTAQSPTPKLTELWRNCKSQITSGIQEIIDAAQPPYALHKYNLPLILIVTPEIVYLPQHMGSLANVITTGDGGGLADISAALVAELDKQGVNVHVTLPEYQNLFKELARIKDREYQTLRHRLRDQSRIYPITDDIFKTAQKVYDDTSSGLDHVNLRRADAFMRGVISRLLPDLKARYRNVLVHCNDWMTGLIPAAARNMRIRSLMTFHNVFTMHQQVSGLKKQSIDITPFWRHLIMMDRPGSTFNSFRRVVSRNPHVDFMNSGLYAADYINTVSRTFLKEMVEGYFKEHNIMSKLMRNIIIQRFEEGCATGIRNAPASTADPSTDSLIAQRYSCISNKKEGIVSLMEGKRINKAVFQKKMGLAESSHTPLFFWPSRIARPQKGFELLLEILPALMHQYTGDGVQIAVAANGEEELINWIRHFQDTFPGRVSYRPFSRELSQLGIAGSDFILMPSLYEPCGTPQVVGQFYGTPPVVRKTGGLADTVKHLSYNGIDGNGFVFEEHNGEGFMFGIREAVSFYHRDEPFKSRVLERIVRESMVRFNIRETAKKYIEVYQEIFTRSGKKVEVV
jgi:ADP-glucose type glycogen/starch synthase